MKNLLLILFAALISCTPEETISPAANQGVNQNLGTLFIIGGGARPDAMIGEMVTFADLADNSYGLVFTQTSIEPDTSFFYINRQLKAFTDRPMIMFGGAVFPDSRLDSIRSASLIFITGGDQSRFLRLVPEEARFAIAEAYAKGALVGGTSAGAALMSKVMISGDQRLENEYTATYPWLNYENGIYTEGLGLLDSAIVDQHFVARSRYNRIISALADTGYPVGVGIDESTALVVNPGHCTVVGENQVIVFHRPEYFKRQNDRIGLNNMRIDIYLHGDTFNLKN